jgi:hypothetical protein
MDATAQIIHDPKVSPCRQNGLSRAINGFQNAGAGPQPVRTPRCGIPAILTMEASRGDDTST